MNHFDKDVSFEPNLNQERAHLELRLCRAKN
jgi:hypothetical protein